MLKAQRRGRPPVSRWLAPHQAATTVRHIFSGCPDQLSLPFARGLEKRYKSCCRESSMCRFRCGRWDAICELRGLTRRSLCDERTNKIRRRYEMAGAGISIDSRTSTTVYQAGPLVRRNGTRSDHQASDPTDGAGRRQSYLVRQRFRCNMISSRHNRGGYLRDLPPAFHDAGVSEFSWPSGALDAEDQEESVSDCGRSPGTQVASSDTLAGRALS